MDAKGALTLGLGLAFLLLPGLLWYGRLVPGARGAPTNAQAREARIARLLDAAALAPIVGLVLLVDLLFLVHGILRVPINRGSVLVDVALLVFGALIVRWADRRRGHVAHQEPRANPIVRRLTLAFLLVALAVGAFVARLPGAGTGLPVHVDEFNHIAFTRALMRDQTLAFESPFYGGGTTLDPEPGFHLLAAAAHLLTGASLSDLATHASVVFTLLLVLATFAAWRLHGAGWEAALLAGLMPTTIRFLGPAFFVPVALGLVLIPATLALLDRLRGLRGKILLVLLVVATALIHLPSAFAVGAILALRPFAERHLPAAAPLGRLRAAAMVLVATAFVLEILGFGLRALLAPPPKYLPSVDVLAYIAIPVIALSVVGLYVAFQRGEPGPATAGLAFGAVAIVVTVSQWTDWVHPIMYDRGILYLMGFAYALAGYGLSETRRMMARERVADWVHRKIRSLRANRLPWALLAVEVLIAGAVTAHAVDERRDEFFYRMVDPTMAKDYRWIEENVAPATLGIIRPWQSKAFVALTGLQSYSALAQAPDPDADRRNEEATAFFDAGASNTTFLRQRNITLVYSWEPVQNPDLDRVPDTWIYLLGPRP